ncbi:CLUMA_CG012528, isoform A [Clunio marinus]|uniref:CLUMA_CG012528, isoform A n=1 Tax=Clunio marinus TaxID=568069 RepID=A0A1J1IG79_9DIPT|nr:CLUMA_CG012528, isoform A [Clunio marinus]
MDETIADIILEPDNLLTKVIRYGLYFGALFQIVCIGAVIFITDTSKNPPDYSDTESEASPQLTPKRSHHRRSD